MKYFAYGSNMDPEKMRERGIGFSQRARAILKDYRLEFNKKASHNPREGYANIVSFQKGIVEGIVYEIRDADLAEVDRFEGYPNHYNRIDVKLLLKHGQAVNAVTYIACPNKVRDGLKPSREYLDHLMAGRDLLSESYRRKLEALQPLNEW